MPLRRIRRVPSLPSAGNKATTTQVHVKLPQRPPATRLSVSAVNSPIANTFKHQKAQDKLRQSLTELLELNIGNQDRIRLALGYLPASSQSLTVRVAVLGVSSPRLPESSGLGNSESLKLPAKFLKALLTNPFSRAQQWEEELDTWVQRPEQNALLLCFSSSPGPITLLPGNLWVLPCPSAFLGVHGIEILLSSLPATNTSPEDAYAPIVSSTPSTIRWPVHKSLVFSSSLEELFIAAGLMSQINETDAKDDTIIAVASLPGLSRAAQEQHAHGPHSRWRKAKLKMLEIDPLEDALVGSRGNPSKVSRFEHQYLESGMEDIKKWILPQTFRRSEFGLLATKSLIASIFANAEKYITLRWPESSSELTRNIGCLKDTLQSLTTSLQSWSQLSHTDLQDSVITAFACYEWKSRLSWWKLPFTFDEIPYLVNVALDSFLKRCEKEGQFLAGRMWGAGFKQLEDTLIKEETELALKAAAREVKQRRSLQPPNVDVIAGCDFPPFIPYAIERINAKHIPILQNRASHILRKSLTWTSLSAFTSALLYFSLLSLETSLSATAFGIVWSAGYMQRQWGRAKRDFEKEVKEEGRKAVNGAEKWAWDRLRKGLEREIVPTKRKATEEAERAKKAIRNGWEAWNDF